MGVFNLADQFINYYEYHTDPINQIIHFIFVPMLTFGFVMILAAVPVQWPLLSILFSPETKVVMNLAFILLLVLVAYYLMLDRVTGSILALEFVSFLFLACHLRSVLSSDQYFVVAVLVQVVGWAVQFLGHYWEGKRPALVDNGLQVFIAPLFVMVEAMFFLGFKKELKAEIQQKLKQRNLKKL